MTYYGDEYLGLDRDELRTEITSLTRQLAEAKGENAEMRRTFGSHPLFAEKDAEIEEWRTKLSQSIGRELRNLQRAETAEAKVATMTAALAQLTGGDGVVVKRELIDDILIFDDVSPARAAKLRALVCGETK